VEEEEEEEEGAWMEESLISSREDAALWREIVWSCHLSPASLKAVMGLTSSSSHSFMSLFIFCFVTPSSSSFLLHSLRLFSLFFSLLTPLSHSHTLGLEGPPDFLPPPLFFPFFSDILHFSRPRWKHFNYTVFISLVSRVEQYVLATLQRRERDTGAVG